MDFSMEFPCCFHVLFFLFFLWLFLDFLGIFHYFSTGCLSSFLWVLRETKKLSITRSSTRPLKTTLHEIEQTSAEKPSDRILQAIGHRSKVYVCF